MDIDAVLTALENHATTAGAAVTPALTDVTAGLPVPRGRCVRIYWDGEIDPPRMTGRVPLSSEMIGDRLMVTAFWPVGDAGEAAHRNRILEMWGFAAALRTALDTDMTLGGEVQTIRVGDATPGVTTEGGGWYATVDTPVEIGYREQEIHG